MDEEQKKSSPEGQDPTPGGEQTPTPGESQDTSADNASKQAPDTGNPDTKDAPDDELVDFGKSRGFSDEDLQNPAVLKALKQAKDSKSASDKNYQEKREAEKKISTFGKKADVKVDEDQYDDPIEKDIAQIKANDANRSREMATAMFFTMKPEAVKFIDTMDKIAEDRPYLYNDLDVLYELAVARSTDPDAAKEAGRKEAEERLAKGQQASAPSRSASNSAPSGNKKFTRSQVMNMSRSEYEENRAAIVAAEASGTIVEDM